MAGGTHIKKINLTNSPLMTQDEITAIATEVASRLALCTKEMLTVEETARYLGITKSHLYKLTSAGKIPYYKPSGKLCYFKRTEIEQWLQTARMASSDEIDRQAQSYLINQRFSDSAPARRDRTKPLGRTSNASVRK